MLNRKIQDTLLKWKHEKGHNPLVVKGIRQCGKTFIVRHFAESHYSSTVYVNFALHPEQVDAFVGTKDVEVILMNLSTMMPEAAFIPGDTCIILDEIQECPDARTALKSFKLDGRFDVIATGSLLGVKGYGERMKKENDPRLGRNSVPVGYETIVEMYPLDFEEFLWANGIRPKVIDTLRECLKKEQLVPWGMHQTLMQLLYRYAVVGGLPAVVNRFVETKHLGQVAEVFQSIIAEYEDDMVKYADDQSKAHIRECFESIPMQLAKEYKKFQYATIKKGARSSQYLGCLQWLEDAGIIRRCYNTTITELPLAGNAMKDEFKVYVADIGLLLALLDSGTRTDVLQGNLLGYKGAIFENLMADFLGKRGKKLYYFRKDTGLELDFLVRYRGECVPLEVKAKSGKAKSLTTVLDHPDHYHVRQAIKFGNYNIGRNGPLLTLPLYMGFLLDFEDDASITLPELDIEAVNRMA
ncbi:MAG: ATP-binding protein [Bacteroidales bacterium]|nr:ATP-binding protein [Bacteroidales bacterium]